MNLRRDVFQAIAEPTRRAILLLVASQAMTAGAIATQILTRQDPPYQNTCRYSPSAIYWSKHKTGGKYTITSTLKK